MESTGMAARAALVAALALAGPAQAGDVVNDAFVSAALGREVNFAVYLPDGYRQAAARYPALYLLHGAGADENEWARNGAVADTLGGLARRRLMRPTVAIMPSFGGGSWWADGAVDKAETAFMRELIPYVERKYKVATERSARSIGGESMGGYGALNLALKYPDRFCGAAVLSPAIYDPLPPPDSAARRTPQFGKNGKFDDAAWKALNYPAHLEAYQRTPLKVPMWIASGDHDHLGIALQSAQLYWRMFQIQPKQVELRIVDGGHDWPTFRATLPDALLYVDARCVRNQ